MRARGFTLIEVLIASALLAVIGLAVAETLRATRDADRRIQARMERRARDRAVLDRIGRDLRGLMPPGGLHAAGLVGEDLDRTSGRDALSSQAEETAADARAREERAPSPPFAGRDRMTLAVLPASRRFGQTTPLGRGAIESIVWEVDDDPTTTERGLVRRPTTVQGPLTGADPEPSEAVGPEVCGLELRYFDGTDWQLTWDSSAQDLIPRAVEVVLAVRDPDGTIRRLAAVVAPLAARPSELVEPGQ